MSRRRKKSTPASSGCPHCGVEGLEPMTGRPRVGQPIPICPACRGPV